VRDDSQKAISLYNINFNREYVYNAPENIASSFSVNGALKIENGNSLNNCFSERAILENKNLFIPFRGVFYSRSYFFMIMKFFQKKVVKWIIFHIYLKK
jgi:hypothetical protein